MNDTTFFHVSKKFLGNEFTFTPRLPETALISKEGDTPRVCVSVINFLMVIVIKFTRKKILL